MSRRSSEPSGLRDWAGPFAVALAAGVIWFGQWQSERSGYLEMPAAERQGLYERTLENLRELCAAPADGDRRSFCHAQAELVLRLPECDAACVQLARQNVAPPTR